MSSAARFAHIPCRHFFLSDHSVVWTWPGGYAEFFFVGSRLQIDLEGKECQVRISIDNAIWKSLQLGQSKTTLCWEGSFTEHLVRIQTTHQESDRPLRLFVPQANSLYPAPPRQHMIEFVGDSWTCGFGNLSENALESDATKAYAALVAQELDCDYSLISVSGHGIAKNFGEIPPSPQSIPVKYIRTQSHIAESTVCEERRANVGVILAGENDFSFTPYPDSALFQHHFHKLLDLMRSRHPGIQLFIAGVSRNHPAKAEELACFQHEIQCGKKDIFWIDLPDLDSSIPLGYLWHPSVAHHKQLATLITKAISAIISL